LKWKAVAFAIGTVFAGRRMVAQQRVTGITRGALQSIGVAALLAIPAQPDALPWRLRANAARQYLEGCCSPLDPDATVRQVAMNAPTASGRSRFTDGWLQKGCHDCSA
jgi:hypothetical protein